MPSIVQGFPGAMRTAQPGLQVLRIALALTALGLGALAVVAAGVLAVGGWY